MPAPGWYPDPDGSHRLPYSDGAQWTSHTTPHPAHRAGGAPQGSSFTEAGHPQQNAEERYASAAEALTEVTMDTRID